MKNTNTNSYTRVIGMRAIGSNGALGIITAVNHEDGQAFAVIDDQFEVSLAGSSEVHDIRVGKAWVRLGAHV